MKPISQLLEEGAEIIVQRGKCENTLENRIGQVCALGAMMIACSGSVVHYMWAYEDPRVDVIMDLGDASKLVTFNNSGPGPSGGIPTAQETADYMIEMAKKYRNRGE